MDGAERFESCVYRTVNGHDVVADVHLGGRAERRPVVLWLHGGGMIFGSRRHLPEWQLERYLEEGFAVVAADYRLAPEARIEDVVSDAVEAFGWVTGEGADRFGFDPERVAVVGHSAGAYLALNIPGRVEQPPTAVVSFYGYGTLGGEWSRTPSQHYREMLDLDEQAIVANVGRQVVSDGASFALDGRMGYYLLSRRQGTWLSTVCGGGRESDAEWLNAFEPALHVTDRFPPTLLLHGDADNDVPVDRSVELANALDACGVKHRFIRRPEWEHLFDVNMFDLSSRPSAPSVGAAFDEVTRFLHAAT